MAAIVGAKGEVMIRRVVASRWVLVGAAVLAITLAVGTSIWADNPKAIGTAGKPSLSAADREASSRGAAGGERVKPPDNSTEAEA